MSPTLQTAAQTGGLQTAPPRTPCSPRVLVVDDEVNFARRLKMALAAAGFDAAVAFDGEAALALAVTRPPDLIVLDLRMPGMDGIACLRALRARFGPVHPHVILLTGHSGTCVEVAGLVYNAAGVMRKPCTYEDVVGVARRLLRGSSPE